MAAACSACGLAYEREPGFFVGAIAIDWLLFGAVAILPVVVLDAVIGLTLAEELEAASCLGLLVPLVLFRYSRSLWLAFVYLLTSRDTQRERLRTRSSRRPRSP